MKTIVAVYVFLILILGACAPLETGGDDEGEGGGEPTPALGPITPTPAEPIGRVYYVTEDFRAYCAEGDALTGGDCESGWEGGPILQHPGDTPIGWTCEYGARAVAICFGRGFGGET